MYKMLLDMIERSTHAQLQFMAEQLRDLAKMCDTRIVELIDRNHKANSIENAWKELE